MTQAVYVYDTFRNPIKEESNNKLFQIAQAVGVIGDISADHIAHKRQKAIKQMTGRLMQDPQLSALAVKHKFDFAKITEELEKSNPEKADYIANLNVFQKQAVNQLVKKNLGQKIGYFLNDQYHSNALVDEESGKRIQDLNTLGELDNWINQTTKQFLNENAMQSFSQEDVAQYIAPLVQQSKYNLSAHHQSQLREKQKKLAQKELIDSVFANYDSLMTQSDNYKADHKVSNFDTVLNHMNQTIETFENTGFDTSMIVNPIMDFAVKYAEQNNDDGIFDFIQSLKIKGVEIGKSSTHVMQIEELREDFSLIQEQKEKQSLMLRDKYIKERIQITKQSILQKIDEGKTPYFDLMALKKLDPNEYLTIKNNLKKHINENKKELYQQASDDLDEFYLEVMQGNKSIADYENHLEVLWANQAVSKREYIQQLDRIRKMDKIKLFDVGNIIKAEQKRLETVIKSLNNDLYKEHSVLSISYKSQIQKLIYQLKIQNSDSFNKEQFFERISQITDHHIQELMQIEKQHNTLLPQPD